MGCSEGDDAICRLEEASALLSVISSLVLENQFQAFNDEIQRKAIEGVRTLVDLAFLCVERVTLGDSASSLGDGQ